MEMFFLEIISPDGIIFKDEVNEVILPTDKGRITILPHHAPIFTKLSEGEVVIKKKEKESLIGITGGFLQGADNKITLLADYAVRGENVEIAKAQEAKKKAEEALEGKKEAIIAERDLKRSILELKIADKLRKRGIRS